MNVTVEAEAATASVSISDAHVFAQVTTTYVVKTYVSASTVRSLLRQGRSSLTAIPGDLNLMNGASVLV